MTDSQDPKSCVHENVTTAAGEFEHYDRLGPGCWHPVDGGQCRSWQALIEHAQNVAAARAEARVRAEVAEELNGEANRLREGYRTGPYEHSIEHIGGREAAADWLEARATPREDKPIKVNLITHWLHYNWVDHDDFDAAGLPPGLPREQVEAHREHGVVGAWSAFGWRELRCTTCDKTLWTVGTPQDDKAECAHAPAYLVDEFFPSPTVVAREYRCSKCGVIYSVEAPRGTRREDQERTKPLATGGIVPTGHFYLVGERGPEPIRRGRLTDELTDQERYEIEEAAAAMRAEIDPDEIDRREDS